MPRRSRLDLLDLPNETLFTIFGYLSNDSLVALVRVCRRLHSIGERLLYANIVISESVDGDPESIVVPYKTEGCCSAVRYRPHLAASIKKLVIRWNRDRARKHYNFRLAPGILQSLHHLLHVASGIEVLELHLAGFHGSFFDLLAGVSFRLRSLGLSGPLNDPIEWFLATQPGIVHLHLGDHHNPLNLAPRDLPILDTFRGDTQCASSILPGRPVRGLALSGHEPSERLLIAFGYTRCPIRYLDLSALSITATQLLTISKHLTALEILRMRLALRHTLHFTFSGMMLLQGLTQVLGAFQNLIQLDLSPTSVDGVVGIRNETEELALCNSWGGACPSLRRVKFPSGADWTMSLEGQWRPRNRDQTGRQPR